MTWFELSLLAAFLYAVVNLLDDNLLRFVYKSPALATCFAGLFGSVPLVSRVWLHADALPLSVALAAVTGGLLTVAYYYFYFKGLDSDSPSVVIALFSLAPATLPFFAAPLLHEHLAHTQIIGFSIVLVASLGLSITSFRRMTFSKAIVPVLIAVVLMDAAALLSKYAFQGADFYPVYICFAAGMGLGGLLLLPSQFFGNKQNKKALKKLGAKLLPLFLLVEIANLAAEFTINLALSRGPVSLVKAVESAQPMFVLLIAVALYPFMPAFFREAAEGKLKLKFGLMCIIIVGLSLVAGVITSSV